MPLTLICGDTLLTAPLGHTWQQGQQQGSMPGMDMSGDADMSSMGPSMAAMAGHMYMTLLRPKQPGAEEKANTIVTALKAILQRPHSPRKRLLTLNPIRHPIITYP